MLQTCRLPNRTSRRLAEAAAERRSARRAGGRSPPAAARPGRPTSTPADLRLPAAPSDHDLRRAGGLRHAGRDERPGAVAARSKRRSATTCATTAQNGTGVDHDPGADRLGQRGRRGLDRARASTTRWCAPACRASHIQVAPYEVGDHAKVAPLRLSYLRVKAVVPHCGIWPEDAAERLSTTRSYHNFGCAAQQNLAAMVANPADLLRPQPMAPANGARRANVITKYGAGRRHASRTSC